MKSNFEERKQNRLEAFQRLAAKNDQLSFSQWDRSNKLADVIPLGQPILIGHHSEKRHRKHMEKIHTAMDNSIKAGEKAKYYEARADSLLNGTAISSDDPNAIDKLQTKLENLLKLQELYKAINKVIKAKKTPAEKVAALVEMGINEQRAVKFLEKDFCGRIGVPSYMLTNNNGVINNTRKRIAHLTSINALVTTEEEINGVTLKISAEDNRVQIFFPGKPSEEVRKSLKRSGFHWAPSVGAWMRQISNWAIHEAREILTNLPA